MLTTGVRVGDRMGKLIRVVTALAKLASCACCLALAPASWGMANAADRVVLQLHRGAQFEFAGYYAALWKGFYREAGLDVEIKPGSSPGARPLDALREVIERRAQFATGTTQLLVRAAQGSPPVLLAPIFQRSGTAVYFRSDSDFSSIRSLVNARLGRMPPSNVLDLEFRAAALAGGVNP